MSKKASVEDSMNYSQKFWRDTIMNGEAELVTPLMRDGFTPDSPISDLGRSPLIDLCLIEPDNHAHAKALAETARVLINAGATLNLPDYKGLVPADYALASPNPLVARQVVLATLRNEVHHGLENSYNPQIHVLFCLAMCKPERQMLHRNITRNLDVVRGALQPNAIKADPLLLAVNRDTLDFWQTFCLQDMAEYPTESSAMRQQFRKVASLEALAEAENTPHKEVVSPAELEEEQSKYRMLEWRHARIFYTA